MSDREFAFDARINHGENFGRVRVIVACVPVPTLKVAVMYVDEAGDDDADIAVIVTDNRAEIESIRDALNQALGGSR